MRSARTRYGSAYYGGSSTGWRSRLIEGPVCESLQIEPVNVLQQFHKGLRPKGKRKLALLGGRKSGVADRAARVQVLGHPAESDRPERTEPLEVFGHFQRSRNGRNGALLVHRFGLVGENQRGLNIARVYAVALLHPLERSGRITEAMPRASHDHHFEADAQIAGNHFHGCNVTPVAGDDHELAHPA